MADAVRGAATAAAGAALALPARLLHEDAPEWLGRLHAAAVSAGRGGLLMIDCAPLGRFDSSALAVLLAAARAAAAAGAVLALRAPPANLRKLAALYGADALLFPAPPSPAG